MTFYTIDSGRLRDFNLASIEYFGLYKSFYQQRIHWVQSGSDIDGEDAWGGGHLTTSQNINKSST